MRTILISTLVLIPTLSFAQGGPSGAQLYAKKCASCHTIGEGDRAGPDLLGVAKRREKAWMQSFIANPNAKIDAGDSNLAELVKKFNGLRMPPQELTPEEFEALYAYLEDCTAKGGCKPEALGKVKLASTATPEEIVLGQKIFEGAHALANSGPACISCHNVRGAGILGGGTMGKDLTFVYARLQDQGLQAALDSTPFPLMKDVYAKHALLPEEAFALKAYFWSASKDGTAPGTDRNFLYLGVIGLFAALGSIGAVWQSRLRGVRKQIVEGGKA